MRLWSQISGVWQWNDYIYTAAAGAASAQITSPPPGSTLTSSAVTFITVDAQMANPVRINIQ